MRILIIDDDENIRRLVSFNLSMEGHEIIQAENGKIGYQTAGKEQPELILLDVMMPVMDGIETVKKLKTDEATKEIPVFMLSAKGQMEDLDEAFDAGADNYITKPFNVEKLNAKIAFKMKN
jgi:two-component system, OmpR family, response regulator RpaA